MDDAKWDEMARRMSERRDPDTRERLEAVATQFEKEHGPVEFLKVNCSALNRILVDKGVIEEGEMRERYLAEIETQGIIASDEQADQELVTAFREIEAAERRFVAIGLLDEVKVKKLKGKVVNFLHSLGKFRSEVDGVVESISDSVQNPRSLASFPELKDILQLARAIRQVRLPVRDVESRILQVVTVDSAA